MWFLIVFLLSVLELWIAVPLGFIFKLEPWIIFVVSSLGGLLGVYLSTFLGKKVTMLLNNFLGQNYFTQENRLVVKIWRHGGLLIFGLLAPLMAGPLIGGIYCIILSGGQSLKSVLWVAAGTVLTCAAMTLLIALGIWVFTS
ncbi:MAG: hypothetical protein FWF37_01580 [Chloroflexi bacterium]|nr:hypothetical protein [Chloroflexota bacterium]